MIFAMLGLVVLLFSAVGFLTGAALWLSYLHLAAGLAGVGYGLFTSSAELREIAGRDASRRGARYGGNALVQTAALAFILGCVAYLSVRYPVNWDWTEAKLHSLTRATGEVLEQIPEDAGVEIYAFFTQGSEGPARDVLGLYTYESDRVRFRIFDPNRHPDLATRFEIRTDGEIVVCGGPCEEAKGTSRIAEASEQELTKAIRSVISEQKKVYFLTGHGEGAIDDENASGYSRIKAALEDENLEVESLLLANLDTVPEDADAVLIAGPSHSILERELATLDRYLRGGGSVLVLSDPIVVTNLEGHVREWGIELGNDVIVDQQIDLFMGPRIGIEPVVAQYGEHAITEDLGNNATLFQLARSVRAAEDTEAIEIAFSSSASWAETDVELFSRERKVGLDAGRDAEGPVPLAAARAFPVEEDGKREGRLVVVGDADFARNRHVAKVFNADLFLNIANWLVGEEQFATIERKLPRASHADMTRQQLATFRYLSLFVLPESILLIGIVSWWRRRS